MHQVTQGHPKKESFHVQVLLMVGYQGLLSPRTWKPSPRTLKALATWSRETFQVIHARQPRTSSTPGMRRVRQVLRQPAPQAGDQVTAGQQQLPTSYGHDSSWTKMCVYIYISCIIYCSGCMTVTALSNQRCIEVY